MKFSDLKANTDLVELWPDDGDHGVWMRPMSQGMAKRLRAAGNEATRLADAASALEEDADEAELACELHDENDDEDPLGADARQQCAEEARTAAEKARESAEAANRAFLDLLFGGDVVVDGLGHRIEGDPDEISPTLIVRLMGRIEEVHREMGKRPRSRRTARRGSARGASTRTDSA